ncbi:MAG: ABC transporter permease [Treponema sp.]|jgi:NitT/TauT family transport system permease protein|nr:ABC transporter permease [Treponema sp.]
MPEQNGKAILPEIKTRQEVAPLLRKLTGIVIALAVLLLAWALAAKAVGKPFLPYPIAVFNDATRLGKTGALGKHTAASLYRIFWALLTGFFPAAALGLAAGRSKRLNAVVSPFIYIAHPLPKVVFLPLIMLFLGLGDTSKIFLLAFTIFSQALLAMRDVSARVNESYVAAARSMGANRTALFFHVILPASLPDLCTALRVCLGTVTAVLFLAETFAAEAGLGYLIVDAWTRVAYTEMFAGILTMSALGLLLFGIVDMAERILCPWES